MKKTRRKCLNDFRGFEGSDSSLSIALFEYGLLWKKIKKDTYRFIYGIGICEGENGAEYNLFDSCELNKKYFDSTCNETWFNIDDVCRYCGIDKKDFVNSFPYSVYDSVSYHGYANIFGESYYGGFEILGNKYA